MRIKSVETFTTQGPRPNMQDVAVKRLTEDRTWYLGVFDGHGEDGYEVARAASSVVEATAREPFDRLADVDYRSDYIKYGLGIISTQMRRVFFGSGSTATVLTVRGRAVSAVHLGDSEAYFYPYEDDAVALIRPHTVENEAEVNRVQSLGCVALQRTGYFARRDLTDKLQISRAVGDHYAPYVSHDAEKSYYEVSKPGILVVASDGLWGDMHDEVETAVRRGSFSQAFVEQCALRTEDNATAIVAHLESPTM